MMCSIQSYLWLSKTEIKDSEISSISFKNPSSRQTIASFIFLNALWYDLNEASVHLAEWMQFDFLRAETC